MAFIYKSTALGRSLHLPASISRVRYNSYFAVSPDPRMYIQNHYYIKFGDGSHYQLLGYNPSYWAGYNSAGKTRKCDKILQQDVLRVVKGIRPAVQELSFPGAELVGQKIAKSEWYCIGDESGEERQDQEYSGKLAKVLREVIDEYPSHAFQSAKGVESAIQGIKQKLEEVV